MNIWTYKTSKERTVSPCKWKQFIIASCILFFFEHLNVGKFHKYKINKHFDKKAEKKSMNWIQINKQNVDRVNQHPKAWPSLLPLHWSTFYSIVTQFWCCFLSYYRFRLHVEASVVSVSSSLVFFLCKYCKKKDVQYWGLHRLID